jgi:cytochrome c oxidase subunit 3/cytochrome o ubiquinol oxidase subunit 3
MAHSAEDHHDIHLPSPTYWPMLLGIGAVLIPFGFITSNIRDYALFGNIMMGAGLAIVVAALFGWTISSIRERRKSHETPMAGVEAAKFAMWCFLGTECILFGGLIANAITNWVQDSHINEHLQTLDSLVIVSINTFLLLASSLCVVLALDGIQKGDRNALARWLGATALLGAAFVAIQGYEYSKLFSEGIELGASKFANGFFFLTGFHGLHVIAGVLWALVLVGNIYWLNGFSREEHMGVEVFGLYWHFVDVVWIFIFTLIYLI